MSGAALGNLSVLLIFLHFSPHHCQGSREALLLLVWHLVQDATMLVCFTLDSIPQLQETLKMLTAWHMRVGGKEACARSLPTQ